MRHATALLILAAALAVAPAPFGTARATDIALRPMSPDALKSACAAAGGAFSQDANRYGCGSDCHGQPGTDCIVSCAPAGKCTAQVTGARRPHSVAEALQMPERHRR